MKKHQRVRKPELAGLIRFSKETFSALGLALIFIVYVVQAFRIPSGSMEDSLLVGDQLLGVKFAYGSPVLPFTHMKFPGIKEPKPGEVVIFKTPGNNGKDYIKRCIAGPGQVVEIRDRMLLVDGISKTLPPAGKHVNGGDPEIEEIRWFAPYRVPGKGELIDGNNLSIRDALFLKHIVHQENPRSDVSLTLKLLINGDPANHRRLIQTPNAMLSVDAVSGFTRLDTLDNWVTLNQIAQQISSSLAIDKLARVELCAQVLLNGKPLREYRVRNDNYFMLGDNRDNSLDSRYWGVVNRSFIKAQAAIIYFSLDPDVPFWNLARKIRWNRFGKLIRSWEKDA